MKPSFSPILPMAPFLCSLLSIVILFYVSPTISTSRDPSLHSQPYKQTSFRVSLSHVDSGSNLTKFERIQRAMKRGQYRLSQLNAMVLATDGSSSEDVKSSVYPGSGEFLMKLAIGTPPEEFSAIMDTGSDLIWTQCKPCQNCYDQPTPIFDPKKSSSFSQLSCSSKLCGALPASHCRSDSCEYLYAYGDYSSSQGIMATETFSFGGNVSVANLGFGCGEDNEGSGFSQGAGLVGLGRGPLSLVSQLEEPTFSYCLTSIDDTKTSSLLVGSLDSNKIDTSKMSYKTTPLIKNPSQPSFYYLNLEGITVGGSSLPIKKSTFALNKDGSGGMIIDSGTTITYLENSAFRLVKKEFVNHVNLKVDKSGSTGLDLCFELPTGTSSVEVPKLVFHFENADLELPVENYMIADSSVGLMCLAMGGSSGMSILGNVQQQNILIVHDLSKETLSFIPTQCDQL
ncbi:aspartic proteinase nepenthesin-1 [Impatiens glandulifera]|uniref:aspartic proteinase nepenthesin-1 n=1 Tax=Impatiens glandulifera TaxID=253017 RepID=UPI001FB0D7D3|nr:aspartic proteinase nepenthesin-1 [Impatiens glandulifera]